VPDLTGKVLVKQYQIMEKLGEGGMAYVYRAWDRVRNCVVAIKVMEAVQDDRTSKRRFRDEARFLVELDHPHIVRFYELVEENEYGVPFIVMDYIEGRSLAQLLADRNGEPLQIPEVIRIAHQIGSALNYAHKKHVYHRDVKPSNILLDKNGTAYLADFGVALLTKRSRYTAVGQIVGTLDYAAPEQLSNDSIDARTDVYGLGALLYELLTGRPPFATRDYLVLIRHIHTELPEPPSHHNPRTPPKVDQVVLKALQKEKQDRYPNVARMINALLATLEIADDLAPFDEQDLPEDDTSTDDSTAPVQPGAFAKGNRHESRAVRRLPRRPWIPSAAASAVLLTLVAVGLWLWPRLEFWQPSVWQTATPSLQALAVDDTPLPSPTPTVTHTATPVPPVTPVPPTPTPTPTPAPSATPTPTASPTPTSTPSPTFSPTPHLTIAQNQLDVHRGPGESYRILGQVNQGDKLAILGRSPSGTWWQVDYLGWSGWVLVTAASASASAHSVPTVPVPPTSVNRSPVIQTVRLEPPTIEAWGTVSMTCQASDEDGDMLAYSWQASGGTIIGEGKAVVYNAPTVEGDLAITATVQDKYGGRATHLVRTKVVAPEPPRGGSEPIGLFGQIWQAHPDVRRKIGWAMGKEEVTFGAQQNFQKGLMFWRDDTDEIYGLTQDGGWQVYSGKWQEGMDEYTCPDVAESKTPPTPRRGFGEIWCKQMGGPNAAIGWATTDEQGYYPHWQRFERGLMWGGHDGQIYVFYKEGTWKSFPYQ
jgi:serine/threonine protein kinase